MSLKPFFPHQGNKSKLKYKIMTLKPDKFNVYYEPFVGSGVIFLTLRPDKAVLNDADYFVYLAWDTIKKEPEDVFELLNKLQYEYESTCFLKHLRYGFVDMLTGTLDTIQPNPVLETAYWITLKKISFMSTVFHEKGFIKKPYPKKSITINKKENIVRISKMLKNTQVLCGDFREALKTVKEGDFVYLDPPYYSTCIEYVQNENTKQILDDVIKEFIRLDALGAYVLLSYSDTNLLKEALKDFSIETIEVYRSRSKEHVKELLIKNYT